MPAALEGSAAAETLVRVARDHRASAGKLLYARLLAAHFVGRGEVAVDDVLRRARQIIMPLGFDAALESLVRRQRRLIVKLVV